MQKIKYINFGIACKVGNTIYINKSIKKYPKLHKALLKHEQEHTDDYDLRDIIIDFQGKYLKSVKRIYYKFLLSTPNAWIQFLPIGIYDKKIVYDPIMIFIWCFLIVVIIGLIIF